MLILLLNWGCVSISTADKLEKRILSIPNDLDFADLVKFLKRRGFVEKQGKSSHYVYVYRKNGIFEQVTIVKPNGDRKFVLRSYVKNVVDTIERIDEKEK